MEDNIEIFIGGDFCPIGRNHETIRRKQYDVLFDGMAKCTAGADLKIINLEAPLVNSTSPIAKSGPNIKANPEAIDALAYLGVNLVTLANNHIMDYGREGLEETLNVCKKANIHTVGAGMDRQQARRPFIFHKGNKKIAVLNFAENEFNRFGENAPGANVVDLVANFNDIKACRNKADVVLVVCHGGREHYQLPTPRQRERYRFYADAGADVVIGHHSHCYSGYETYNGTPIFYSLGNFLFDYKKKYQKGLWTEGFTLKLSIDNSKIDFQLIPFFQGREADPNMRIMEKEDRKIFFDRIEVLNKIITNDELFSDRWTSYLTTQKKYYLSILNTPNKYIRFLKSRGVLPQFALNREHRNVLLNILRCETHHEIMTNILEASYFDNER